MEQTESGSDQHEVAPLRSYTLVKQQVAALIRDAKHLFQTHDAREAAEQCQDLIVQLAEDRFNLAVVGQFKRGKSTLMNAILGRDLLPTGLLPLTSAITTLCYGSTERVLLRRQGWAREQDVPLAQLASWITEHGNSGNEKGLIEARVELPLPFLKRGLHFIDTPGIGSSQNANTATTYAFLPQMAAVIFVTSVEAPLSEAEERFLQDIRGQVRHLFVVVNKIDLLGDSEREEALNYIHTHVERLVGAGNAHLFPLSARDGLTAKQNHDDAHFKRSGLALFEQTLTTFLAEEQGSAFLLSLLDRALRLSDEAAPTLAPVPDESEDEPLERVGALRRSMESLLASLLAGVSLPPAHRPEVEKSVDAQAIEQAMAAGHAPVHQKGERQTPAHLRTCPICAAQGQALFSFFAQWQYTLATDRAAQQAFAASHGLCPGHTWQYQEMASPQGISDGYTPLIEMLASALSQLLEQRVEQIAAPLADLLAGTATCAACRLLRAIASEQIEQILAHLSTAEGREEYASSAGICLPHTQAILAHMESGINEAGEQRLITQFLLHEQVRRLEDLVDDLRSYTLKRDALRRGLLHSEEEHAWRRALVQLVGERAVSGGAIMADERTM